MKDLNVLLSAVGSPTSPMGIQNLKNNGEREIRVIGVDMLVDPTIRQYVDSFYQVPAATDANYIDELLSVCKKEKIDVFIPGMTQELNAVHNRLDEFKSIGVLVSISEGKELLIANDKINLFNFLKKEGITLPKYYVTNTKDDLRDYCYKLGYPNNPVCVKISDGAGSRGVRIIDGRKQDIQSLFYSKPTIGTIALDDFLSAFSDETSIPNLMVMEFLPGPEYCIDALAESGEIIIMVGQKISSLAASTPIEAVLEINDEIYNHAKQVISSLKISGNVGIDYRFDSKGVPFITEVNPRTAQTLSLVCAGGADLRYLRIKQLLGEQIPECTIKYGTHIKRRYLDMFY